LPQADNALILAQTHAWSLYSLFPSALGAECLYWLGLLVSLMFAVGLFTRVTSVLFVVTTWSLYQRNSLALDGGDNLLVILGIYLIFADLSALSLDRYFFGPRREGKYSWLGGMLHNFALTACLLQLAIVYFEAGFYKIQGHVWSNGTAIYYILRSSSYTLPGWSDFIWQSAAIVTLGTYGTILFEIVHPFLMWHPKLKYMIFTGAVLLHAGIGVLMGLVWFALTMIGVHSILFDDSEYSWLLGWMRNRFGSQAKRIATWVDDQGKQRPQLELPDAVSGLTVAD
jgi:antimicrobial peptide system SdpB family protein